MPPYNITHNFGIPNNSNFLILLRDRGREEEDHEEAVKVENNTTLVQDQVFGSGVQGVIGTMARYNTTRKGVET
ncbi:hypothetical protein SESBI_41896 [Sesbania bispinosa]|nr:hypothetical protein SESBI_41896 [Sesbania bispinosa]